ncbi:MAPEG family protein [Zavarzinia sp. CC-PAN008]|uniref:MAPEG family protein n=1 Tax=Zavarzinia sp. CC-PAN008 TaxID=3243332 RepID=UPI003F746FCC
MHYYFTSVVTVAALAVYVWTFLAVGRARTRLGVKAPAVDGPEEFQRVLRVQTNTVEQLILFLPALWLFSIYVNVTIGGLAGLVWCAGRVIYARDYWKAAERRGLGFGISFVATAFLLVVAGITVLWGFLFW